jgi:predicted  nucleic acid-binding Zn-ribbon protein
MFLESFRHLIEIEALKKENLQNSLQIASENKRISDLEERRKKTLLTNESLAQEEKALKLSESQNKIEDLQIRLKKLNSQLSLAVTEKEQVAFESQIKLVKDEVEKLEAVYFENLEASENLLNQIQENLEFMQGSLKTLADIKVEVQTSVAQEEVIIQNRTKRINSLLELCHPTFKSLYLDLDKKFRPKSIPVSFLIDKKCTACHVTVDSILKQSLEEGRSLETCPNCSRLLIPETARI